MLRQLWAGRPPRLSGIGAVIAIDIEEQAEIGIAAPESSRSVVPNERIHDRVRIHQARTYSLTVEFDSYALIVS